MLKKSIFVLLGFILLVGCSNPVKKAEKEISAFLTKEFAKAEDVCLAEYSESDCASVDFDIIYNKESNLLGVHITVYHDANDWFKTSTNQTVWTGTYENEYEFSADIYEMVLNSGAECDFLLFGDEVLGTTKNAIKSASAEATYLNGGAVHDENLILNLLSKINVDTRPFYY